MLFILLLVLVVSSFLCGYSFHAVRVIGKIREYLQELREEDFEFSATQDPVEDEEVTRRLNISIGRLEAIGKITKFI